ncbi:hypothetical protein PR202_ga30031 [Eleusine coracana subsp. coracana]|uniref:(d)CMP kinase n=1 Tax=Eleusine coracana subsp. coracana TaxID=191504 RepID=A0AAV5DMU4_ELECO|nr:hypothetical protein PR202_ga30016 [Eleusine coracana subsp. coracana]GJN11807.1 hypothetical protein PR202_ga30031 [Eleusine coracana subsp. coracana]
MRSNDVMSVNDHGLTMKALDLEGDHGDIVDLTMTTFDQTCVECMIGANEVMGSVVIDLAQRAGCMMHPIDVMGVGIIDFTSAISVQHCASRLSGPVIHSGAAQPWPRLEHRARQVAKQAAAAAAVPTKQETPSFFLRTPPSPSAMDADLVQRCLEAGGRDLLHHHHPSSSSPPSPTSAAASSSSSILQSLPLHVPFDRGYYLLVKAIQELRERKDGLVVTVGIGGPTGSGKTSLAEKVASVLGCVVIVSMEDYRTGAGGDEGSDVDAIDFDALARNLQEEKCPALLSGVNSVPVL